MLIARLLGLSWLILLMRSPRQALPVALAVLLVFGSVIAWVLWQDTQESRRLARLELQLTYAPTACDAERPLQVRLHNHSDRPLLDLRWRITAHRPGSLLDLVSAPADNAQYLGPDALQPGQSWSDCLPLPALRPGYRASTLDFRTTDLRGRFAR